MGASDVVDRYFEITKRGSSYAGEVRGGLATFLTMSYILLVNPQILTLWLSEFSDIQNEFSKDIATATALTCGIGCILVGVLSNMPFSIGPGMGLNTFVAALLMNVNSKSQLEDAKQVWGEVTATTFLAGVVLTVLSAVGLVSPAIAAMPETIKTSIMVGIGAYQAFVGMREMGVIAKSESQYVDIEQFPSFVWDERQSPISGYAQLLFMLSLILTTVLFMKGVKGSILLGIVFCTGICWSANIGGGSFPTPPVAKPTFEHTFMKVYFETWFTSGVGTYLPQMVVILLITIFDCGGVQFGIGKLLDLPKIYEEQDMKNKGQGSTLQGGQGPIVAHSISAELGDDALYVPEPAQTGSPVRRKPSLKFGSFLDLATMRVGDTLETMGHREKLERKLLLLHKLEEEDDDGLLNLTAVKDDIMAKLAAYQPLDEPSFSNDESAPLIEQPPELKYGTMLPGRSSQLTFLSVGLMNIIGAMLGSSPCIVFLECAAGVKEGARTGLASVVTGCMFLTTVVLTPIFQNVPLCASAGPLVFIGCLMMSHVGEIEWQDLKHALPAFLTILMMPFTSSITPGIGFGLAFYVLIRVVDYAHDAISAVLCRPKCALHVATEKGDFKKVKDLLVKHPEALDHTDSNGNTALHVAVHHSQISIIRCLMEHGADLEAANNDLQTPMDIALHVSKGGISPIVRLLQSKIN
eukprot:TRINITY_DN3742_c0_g1_i2.p1 TRINITY_DN3742_c0_g1~~TRINITY_DN3742_c0_g1_i2.p1  ORF type:complete len:693 (+),score=187.21 TRINITY_DN3742_c0_g1_i2:36-2114(+)